MTLASRTPCDNCGHDEYEHSEDHDCTCSKFVYPTPDLVYASIHKLAARDFGPSRDTLEDVLDGVFGRRYSREMKGLLRAAFLEGLTRSGIPDDELDALLDERVIDRIWTTQVKYTRHLKNDLKAAIVSGGVKTTPDLEDWFKLNDYRSQMTGRFMVWQGVNAGYAKGVNEDGRKLRWMMSPLVEQHCVTCPTRHGNTYTYKELSAIGFPGSDLLQCKAACQCQVVAA